MAARGLAPLAATRRVGSLAPGGCQVSLGPDIGAITVGAEQAVPDHREVSVRWEHYDITIAGTVYLPNGPGPFPGYPGG